MNLSSLARRWVLLASLVTAVSASGGVHAQTGVPPKTHVSIALLAEKDTIAPGEEIWVAFKETIEPHWHTYWVNPGDSGEPTAIRWQLPDGFTASEIHWPIPETIPVGPLVNFGYAREVLLLTRIKAPTSLPAGALSIKADADWLVCKDICVPESGAVSLTLQAQQTAAPASNRMAQPQIAAARRMVPQPLAGTARIKVTANNVELIVSGLATRPGVTPNVRFYPLQWGLLLHAAAQPVSMRGTDLVLQLTRGDEKTRPLSSLDGVLVVEENDGGTVLRQGFTLKASAGGSSQGAVAPGAGAGSEASAGTGGGAGTQSAASDGTIGFGKALLFAVLGGLILNLMPCVFPVLSLKAVSLASSAGDTSQHRAHGLAYLGGVLASFALLAAVLLTLRATGQAFGWGFQFQSPSFVLILAALFFALGLSLSGVFTLGNSIIGAGDGLTRRSGLTGSFFTGALATIAATPCTAPFMGAAVGFALTAPAVVCVAVLMAMGLGFAAPMVALSALPSLGRWLPRPGPWLATLKQVMAFPLYATAAWLVWVLSLQAGSEGVLAAMVLITGIGFAAWLAGRYDGASAVYARAIPAGLAAALIAVSVALIPASPADVNVRALSPTARPAAGLASEPFSRTRIDALRASGQPVFVNLTAAWCITCKVNETVALSSDRIRAAFAAQNVAYLKGDWTRQDPEISEFLRSFGRVGVPLYLLYPSDPKADPKVLPQLLTETTIVDELNALKPSNNDRRL